MDHAEEIKKLLDDFWEYTRSPESPIVPMTKALDTISRIQDLINKELEPDKDWPCDRGD